MTLHLREDYIHITIILEVITRAILSIIGVPGPIRSCTIIISLVVSNFYLNTICIHLTLHIYKYIYKKKDPFILYYTTDRSHLLCIRASHPSDLKKPPVPLYTDYSIKRSKNTSTPIRV